MRYDSGAYRHKHHWNQSHAGFQDGIGKCDNTITQPIAQHLLNTAIVYNIRAHYPPTPQRFYNYHHGAIYVAVADGTGAYHGFPYKGWIPRRILHALRNRLSPVDVKAFDAWVKEHIMDRPGDDPKSPT